VKGLLNQLHKLPDNASDIEALTRQLIRPFCCAVAALLIGKPGCNTADERMLIRNHFAHTVPREYPVGVVPKADDRNAVQARLNERVGKPLKLQLRGEHKQRRLSKELRGLQKRYCPNVAEVRQPIGILEHCLQEVPIWCRTRHKKVGTTSLQRPSKAHKEVRAFHWGDIRQP